jgi:hypothetical protein
LDLLLEEKALQSLLSFVDRESYLCNIAVTALSVFDEAMLYDSAPTIIRSAVSDYIQHSATYLPYPGHSRGHGHSPSLLSLLNCVITDSISSGRALVSTPKILLDRRDCRPSYKYSCESLALRLRAHAWQKVSRNWDFERLGSSLSLLGASQGGAEVKSDSICL